jgi:2-aminobenzoate-CoA ligase
MRGFGRRQTHAALANVVLSYAEARERVDRIAQVLTQDLGLVPGNRVLLRGGNSIGMALAWLAVVKAGLVAVATMPLLRAKELGDIIDKAQPTWPFATPSCWMNWQQAQAQHTRCCRPCCASTHRMIRKTWARCAPGTERGHFQACPTAADDIALMAFTSGTTGKPKAAVHSHRDVLAACEAWPRHVLQGHTRRHRDGLAAAGVHLRPGRLLMFPMWAGASVYFPTSLHARGHGEVDQRRGRHHLLHRAHFLPPDGTICATSTALPLRICVSAGEGLPDATRQLWKDATGIEMLDGIGATEMFHIFISSAPGDVRRGAIGKVVPGYTAKVVDDEGHEVPRGTVGKLGGDRPDGLPLSGRRAPGQLREGRLELPGRCLHARR